MERRRTRVWLLALSTVSLAHCLYYAPRTIDDMFIFLRYAENLAAGLGPVYNPGEAVEGFSSPLWVILLALGEWVGLGGVSWSKCLALASFALLQMGTYRFTREVVGASARVAFASCLILGLNSYVVSWTLWGLETPLHLALMMWTAVSTHRVAEGRNRRDRFTLGVVGALFVWGRPESPLFLALVGVGALLAARDWPSLRARILRCTLPASAVVVAWALLMVGRRLYFGLWFPHTHYAKQGHGIDIDRLAALVAQGASPFEIVVLLCGVGACIWLALRRRAMPLLLVLGNVFFVSVVVLDWMPNVRHFLPVSILLPIVVLAASDRLLERGRGLRVIGVLGALVVAGNALVLASLDSRFSQYDFATHGKRKEWTRLKSLQACRDTWACLTRQRPPHVERMNDFEHGMITQVYRVLEADARPLSESWYVARDIGRVGWLSNVKVFDTDGLFTPAVVQSESWIEDGSVDDALVSAAFDRNVIMTEMFGDWMRAAARSPLVRRSFRPVQGNWGYLGPREAHPPEPEQVLARYEAALAKMPSRYYMMTLYGEAVGAALERRVEHIRFHLETRPTLDAVPSGLVGGPIVLDRTIEMLGCLAQPMVASPGEAITLSCYFRALERVARDYTVFVHFEGPNGSPSIHADHAPAGGFHPTRTWKPGEIVHSAVRIRMPEDAAWMRAHVGLFDGNHRAATDAGPLVDPVGRALGPEVRRR